MTTTERTPVNVHIRWMIRRDMPEVLEIENLCFEFPWTEAEFIRALRQRNCIGMIAQPIPAAAALAGQTEQAIVGFMVYELEKKSLRLLNFAVMPRMQRKGIGTQMIAKLIGKLSAVHRTRITCETRESNLDAQLFFKAQGFRAFAVLRDFYEDTDEDAFAFQFRHCDTSKKKSPKPLAKRKRTMATTTAKRKTKTAAASSNGQASAGGVETETISQHTKDGGERRAVAVNLPLHTITPHPKNPRQDFAGDKEQELAESLRQLGLLQPIVVREIGAAQSSLVAGQAKLPATYQLLAGERRWCAAKRLKWETIPASLLDCDDVTALKILGEENLKRGDLNPIELAGYVQTLLAPAPEGGAGMTQAAAAELLAHDASWVSNQVRLLELPAVWQKRVAAGELDQTKARTLLPYTHAPRVMAAFERHYKAKGNLWPKLNASDTRGRWDSDVASIVRDNIASMDRKKKEWYGDYSLTQGQRFACVIPKEDVEANAAELCIVTIGKQEYATNVELFEKLQTAEVKKRMAQRKNDQRGGGKAAKLTPAQQKAAEKQKEAQRASQTRERVRKWRIEWLRWILSECVQPSHWQTSKALLYFTWRGTAYGRGETSPAIERSVKNAGGKPSKNYGHADALKCLQSVFTGAAASEKEATERGNKAAVMAGDFVADILWPADPKATPVFLPDEFVEALAVDYDLDLPKEWAGLYETDGDPLDWRQRFFDMHTRDQLAELAKELKVPLEGAGTKAAVVKRFVETLRALKLPKAIKKVRAK